MANIMPVIKNTRPADAYRVGENATMADVPIAAKNIRPELFECRKRIKDIEVNKRHCRASAGKWRLLSSLSIVLFMGVIVSSSMEKPKLAKAGICIAERIAPSEQKERTMVSADHFLKAPSILNTAFVVANK